MPSPPDTPPPVLDSARLLAYAVVDQSVAHTDRISVFVDGQPLGQVPKLAICETLDDENQFLLFYCDDWWNVLAASAFPTITVARERAETAYPGISAKWVNADISIDEANRFLRSEFGEAACSFCGRLPHQVKRLVQGRDAWICDACINNLRAANAAPSGPSDA